MKALMKILVLIIWSFSGYAQSVLDFKKDFKSTLDNKITNDMVDSLTMKHYSMLLWFYSVDSDVKAYPLKEIINEDIYQHNIDKLFADTGQKVNVLACLLAASTNDISKIAAVKNVLQHSDYKNMLAAKSLLVLGDRDLGETAKCIIAYDFNEAVQYLTIDFLNVEKSLLEKFAVNSLFSHDQRMQYLAVKAIAVIPAKPANEQLLRQAVTSYETGMKGWPIAALAEYKANHILALVKPYLNNDQLEEVCWRALALSSSVEDIDYINQMIVTKRDNKKFLNSLLNSNNEVHLKSWLSILKTGDVPKSYFFNIDKNVAIKSDKYFKDICEIITVTTNELHAYSLMRYFENRKDKASIDFLNACLSSRFSGVQEIAKQSLSN